MRWLGATLLAAACSPVFGDLDRVVAIEVPGGATRTVAAGDTLVLEARAIAASGAVVRDAGLVWQLLDTGQVGFTLDSATGRVVGMFPDTGRVRARVEQLVSGIITVIVTAPPAATAARAAGEPR